MKKILLLSVVFVLVLFALQSKAQSFYEVKFQSEATIKVFVQDTGTVDLLVYKVSSATDATGNTGLWYFPPFPDENSKKIFFVSNPADADIKISYSSSSANAGWINTAKTALLN